jgi:hypothetical protein
MNLILGDRKHLNDAKIFIKICLLLLKMYHKNVLNFFYNNQAVFFVALIKQIKKKRMHYICIVDFIYQKKKIFLDTEKLNKSKTYYLR